MSAAAVSRVLVIDDNPAICEEIGKILGSQREPDPEFRKAKADLVGGLAAPGQTVAFQVVSASQGEEGLRCVQEAVAAGRPFDLAFVDMRMPRGWDGLETVTRIWQVQPDLQIILCTADSDHTWEEVIARLKRPEQFVILKKPFENLEVHQLAYLLIARKRTEEALRESEERFRTLAAATFEGICISENGRIVEVNDQFLALYSCQRSDVVGRKILDLIPPESNAIVAEALRTNRETAYEHRTLSNDGHVIEVETRGRMAVWAGRRMRIAAVRDITVPKRAEEASRRAAERVQVLSKAVEQSPATVVITDTDGRIQYVNRKFVELTGYAAAEVLGQNPRLLKSSLMPAQTYEDLWKTITAGGNWRGDLHNRKKNGELYWESAFISPVTNEQGTITHFLAIKEDITERKHAEQALRETNERLEEAMARANAMAVKAELASLAKSQFLAGMSHEIRTPMNGVIGMTELLLGTKLDSEQRQFASVLRNSGQTLLSIINNILDLSKIEAGKVRLDVAEFDLRAALEDALETVAINAARKGLDLVGLVERDAPLALRGDVVRLRQILVNLAGNALKFTAQGEVLVRALLLAEDESTATFKFAVSDTGIGIPQDRLRLLFSPFVQLEGATMRKYGGTGLGLAISKKLAELMGGSIGVESVEGKGSTFWFTIRFEKQAAPAERPADPPGELAGLRVLLMDRHAPAREALCGLLQSLGCRSTEAPDLSTARTLLAQAAREADPFRVALLDSHTLGALENGSDLHAGGCRGGERLSRVILARLDQRIDAGLLRAAGFDDSLFKPVRLAPLRNCLTLCRNGTSAPREPFANTTAALRLCRPGARILVADDNSTNQLLAAKFIEKLGGSADTVASGFEAIDALHRKAYDLVLMDCQMPDLDGLDATRRIRAPHSGVLNPSIPIIAMTARALEGDRETCLAAGMSDYLKKPLDKAELARTLDRWLPPLPKATLSGGSLPEPRADRGLPADRPRGAGPSPVALAPTAAKPDVTFDVRGFLDRLMGDVKLADMVVTDFLADMPVQIKSLVAVAAAGDTFNATRLAHRIKGAAAAVGGSALQSLAQAMESAGKSADLPTLQSQSRHLDEEFERLRENLAAKAWRTR